jgi:hypothetical protein
MRLMPGMKGKSPFYPGQPIPPELFTGRAAQIRRIKQRGVDQVAQGKPVSPFIQGEYGIGKSSVAQYIRAGAEQERNLHGIYAPLGRATSLNDVAAVIVEGVVSSGAHLSKRGDAVREWLKKYIKEVTLFSVMINVDALNEDASNYTTPQAILNFLGEAVGRLKKTGIKGITLVLDEINGISSNPIFAHFIKDLIETNANARNQLPLLLMMCGTEDRRNDLFRNHPPVGRIFDVVTIGPMDPADSRVFFTRSFGSVQVKVAADAMDNLLYYSGGLPKIMHEIGDAAYYINTDDQIDINDAMAAIEQAADEVGRKYVEPEVVKGLKSRDDHAILEKLARLGDDVFTRDALAADPTDDESRKLDNFLRRMRKLNVIRPGEVPGEYQFNVRMYQVYLTLKTYHPSSRKDEPKHG